jgi:uncharacterized phage protein (TIGR01671 family)
MNREIIFRAQRLGTKEWLQGDLIKMSKIDPFTYIAIGIGYKIDNPELGKSIKVLPGTVGQFTGLTDKNGTKIFEGDIIKVDIFTKPYFISFGKSEKWGACFCVQSKNSIIFFTKNWAETSEIIGNIHDNPELLIF